MDDKCLAYFSSVNPLARKIIKDQQLLRNALGDEWGKLEWQQQEELIDDFFVDISVREKFADVGRPHEYPVSFPKLKIETGEHIVVDFENDCWTWQDEHSSPFNWRSKSQQDLSLDDLEVDKLSKPIKQKKKEAETTVTETTTAPREFSVNSGGSIWESPFLQGMKKPEFLNRSRSASPNKSTSQSRESLARSRTPEEVNYAFTGSQDDLSSSPSGDLDDRSLSVSSVEMLANRSNNDEYKPARRLRSFSKSPARSVHSTSKENNADMRSMVDDDEKETNAFDNPVITQEWSSFVTEDDEPSSATPSPYKKLLREPEPLNMERGDELNRAGSHFDDYHDEILVVEQTSPVPALDQNTSSMSATGFDFLDNW